MRSRPVGAWELQEEIDNEGIGLGGDGLGVEVEPAGKGKLVLNCHWPDGETEKRRVGVVPRSEASALIGELVAEYFDRERRAGLHDD